MGGRALRLALDRDGLMKAQARALLEAAAGKVLHVMFPMVSEPWEYEQARALVEHQREWLVAQKKKLPVAVRYGAMLEVPALAEVLDLLLPRLDFLSIGTNDLTQFLFAADRAHPRLAERYDRSEEHTSELQSLMRISYAVFCLKKKKTHYEDE